MRYIQSLTRMHHQTNVRQGYLFQVISLGHITRKQVNVRIGVAMVMIKLILGT